jgi:hypothetical protein
MMRGALVIPIVHELSGAAGEPVSAVGIPDFEYRAGFGFPFGNYELESFRAIFDHGEQSDLPEFHRHLDG